MLKHDREAVRPSGGFSPVGRFSLYGCPLSGCRCDCGAAPPPDRFPAGAFIKCDVAPTYIQRKRETAFEFCQFVRVGSAGQGWREALRFAQREAPMQGEGWANSAGVCQARREWGRFKPHKGPRK